MTNNSNAETVDRSRLKLLGLLAVAGASGGCQSNDTGNDPLANLTGTLGSPAELRRLEKKNEAATKARAEREKAEWEALVRRNKENQAKRERAIKRIKKYGNPDDYVMTSGGEGGEGGGGGSH